MRRVAASSSGGSIALSILKTMAMMVDAMTIPTICHTIGKGRPNGRHAISLTTGTIATSGGAGISGVSVSNGSTSVTTNASGQYTFANLSNGSYTLTPSLSGYTFSPVNRSVTVGPAVTVLNM